MTSLDIYSKQQTDAKFQVKPSAAGTAGQVLGLDSNLDPVWLNQSGGGSSPTAYSVSQMITAMQAAPDGSIAFLADMGDIDGYYPLSGIFIKKSNRWYGAGTYNGYNVSHFDLSSNTFTITYYNTYGGVTTSSATRDDYETGPTQYLM